MVLLTSLLAEDNSELRESKPGKRCRRAPAQPPFPTLARPGTAPRAPPNIRSARAAGARPAPEGLPGAPGAGSQRAKMAARHVTRGDAARRAGPAPPRRSRALRGPQPRPAADHAAGYGPRGRETVAGTVGSASRRSPRPADRRERRRPPRRAAAE